MITEDGKNPVPLPGEQIFTSIKKVSLNLVMGAGYPGDGAVYKADGNIFITNHRVIFISRPSLDHFKSLSIPLMNIREGSFQQPWFGANYYKCIVIPVPDGGMSSPGELKFIFKEGGGFEFTSVYSQLINRLAELEGSTPPETLEQLPQYTPREDHLVSSSASNLDAVANTSTILPASLLTVGNLVEPYNLSHPNSGANTPISRSPSPRPPSQANNAVASSTSRAATSETTDDLPPSYDEIASNR
ncbi:hypothetical protein G9A89_013507 [Geosiphon pyriformis]|nr:hypothetical protein G9A89_013507 [Geosiphon pyriformis]